MDATDTRQYSEPFDGKFPKENAAELAKLLTTGTWTHDYPITCDGPQQLGLPVRSDTPREFLHLMQLYPQPVRYQPAVEYLPLPRGREQERRGSER
jgi:hypothetical protein